MKYVKTYERFLNESVTNKVFYHGGSKTLRQQDLKSEVISAILPDFGFMSDFDEFEAYVVFDAKKQVKIVQ
jgi:hypothetical protein